jgi:UDP-N-acetylglucosamine/UDP-N-acetylgalactosamine diphosphorylase
VPYIDNAGRLIEPAEPNALKFERFIFDLLPEAERPLAVEIDVAQEFAPVKNPAGDAVFTAEAAQQQMIALYREWLRDAGVEVADDVAVEVSPLAALAADDLTSRDLTMIDVNRPVHIAT